MLYPHQIHRQRGLEQTRTRFAAFGSLPKLERPRFFLGLFFEVAFFGTSVHLFVAGEDQPPRGEINMKNLSVVVAGSGKIRDVRIEPGTTAGDVLHELDLPDYLLSKGPNEPFFAAAESIYDKVKDGEKIFASTKAEVGVAVCA
jgi:hypothetical protein